MPGRTRPIEKFAEAVTKCSAEVNASHEPAPLGQLLNCNRLRLTGNALLQIIMGYTRTNVLLNS